MDLETFKQTKGKFLLDLSAILRTVVSIRVKDGVEDVRSAVVGRKKRSVFRFKRDADGGTGYVQDLFTVS